MDVTVEKRVGKYDCIVLDLDGTLVYSCKEDLGGGHKIVVNDCEDVDNLWVYKRPGFDEFLRICFEVSTVGVWSMGQPSYVDAIVELFPQTPAFVYNRTNCITRIDRMFKQLEKIPYDGNIIMFDDQFWSLEQSDRVNTIIVPPWTADNYYDRVLYQLIPKICKDDNSMDYDLYDIYD